MKKISIIIPVYNAEKYINRCMLSLVRQSIGIGDIEILLVNDASTDNSLQYLRAWEKEFPDSVGIIKLESNVMQGAARNIAMQYATGEYVAYLDSDDYLVPDALKLMYEAAKQNDPEIVAYLSKDVSDAWIQMQGDAVLLDNDTESGMEDEYLIVRDIGQRVQLLFGGMSQRGCWDKLYRRDFILRHDLKYAEGVFDEEALFTIPALMHVKRYYLMNRYLHRYYDNAGGTTGSFSKKTVHLHDNEITCLRMLDKLKKDGILKKEPEVTEAVFVHNYFNRSLTCTHPRGLLYNAEGITMLQKTVHKCFPDYADNPILMNMRSFPYMRKLLEMKVGENDVAKFYDIVTKWEAIVGNEA